MANTRARADELIVVHHPKLGLQTTTSRGAFGAPATKYVQAKKRPGSSGLAAKGWKEGPLPAKAGKTEGGS